LKFKLSTIGLALGLQFPKSSCWVLGLDIDPAKIIEIEAGRSYVRLLLPLVSGFLKTMPLLTRK
jgi:hypothetical protein